MKNIANQIVSLLKVGYCTPQIARLGRKLKDPSPTIHYNIRKLEREGVILAYKAVLNYRKIGEGFVTYLLVNLNKAKYPDPESAAVQFVKYDRIESYELVLKVHSKDTDDYYEFLKHLLNSHGIERTHTLTSLKQFKSEFVNTK